MLGAAATLASPPPPPAGASLPDLLQRLDVGALDPGVAPAVAHAALLAQAADRAVGGLPSALVTATQGVMRSNVMAAVEVLKVFWRAAGGAQGGVPHLAPDKASRFRAALAKQHRAYVLCGCMSCRNKRCAQVGSVYVGAGAGTR